LTTSSIDFWLGLAAGAPGFGEASGDEDAPEASSPPDAVAAEVEVHFDCVAAGAELVDEALVHPVTAVAARTVTAAIRLARVVLEPFISVYPMVVRCGHDQCPGRLAG
jgi:hypothetical protein